MSKVLRAYYLKQLIHYALTGRWLPEKEIEKHATNGILPE